MWDIGGQESLRKDWSTYYSTAEVFLIQIIFYPFIYFRLMQYYMLFHILLIQFLIFVIDSTDRERLHITKSELYNMLSHEVREITESYTFFLKQKYNIFVYCVGHNFIFVVRLSFLHLMQELRHASLLIFANKQDVKVNLLI